jgi:hypothetical protein
VEQDFAGLGEFNWCAQGPKAALKMMLLAPPHTTP